MKNASSIWCIAAMFGMSAANAGNYTTWSVPATVEIVNGGMLVGGAFGDPGNCGVGNYIFVSQTSTSYKEVVALTYMAFTAGKEMSFYANSCTQVGFHWNGNVINLNSDGHTAAVR